MLKTTHIALALLIVTTFYPQFLHTAAPQHSDCESSGSDYSWLCTTDEDDDANPFTVPQGSPCEIDTSNEKLITKHLRAQNPAIYLRFFNWVAQKITPKPKRTHRARNSNEYTNKIAPIMSHLADDQKTVNTLKAANSKAKEQLYIG